MRELTNNVWWATFPRSSMTLDKSYIYISQPQGGRVSHLNKSSTSSLDTQLASFDGGGAIEHARLGG